MTELRNGWHPPSAASQLQIYFKPLHKDDELLSSNVLLREVINVSTELNHSNVTPHSYECP